MAIPILVLDNNPSATQRVDEWAKERALLDFGVEYDVSRSVNTEGWEGLRARLRDLEGEYLILLDLDYGFSEATRQKLAADYEDFPVLYQARPAIDGFSAACELLNNRSLGRSWLAIVSTLGPSDQLIGALEERGRTRGSKIEIIRGGGALSSGRKEQAFEKLRRLERVVASKELTERQKENFRRKLSQIVETHPLFHSPLVEALGAQELNKIQVGHFGGLYYPHVLRTRRYQASVLGACPDELVQASLAAIIYDEYGSGDPSRAHPELYRQFLRALDVEPEAWSEPRLIEIDLYIRSLASVDRSSPWQFAVGAAGLGGELPIPRLYRTILPGLRGVGLAAEAVEVFTEHVDVDERHSRDLLSAIIDGIKELGEMDMVEKGLRFSLDGRLAVLNGIWRHIENVR